ncbi:unnamed protein product [Pleuronectes platessa]|uniref:Uncharacterized protein n=1 Tax=Pleuronectes platessa TaxID=8262 RepID=A0A9N7UU36_PLEPL|nr:unnamed protein product [Pleuronectes platessa]
MPIGGHGFVLDKYKCQCRIGFYHPRRVALNGFKSKELGSHRDETSDVSNKCLPCRKGCPYCRDDTPCLVPDDGALRLAVAAFQGLCMVLDLASMVVVYHFRRKKSFLSSEVMSSELMPSLSLSIRTSGLVLLEAILFGALLLYFPPTVHLECDVREPIFSRDTDRRNLSVVQQEGSDGTGGIHSLQILTEAANSGPLLPSHYTESDGWPLAMVRQKKKASGRAFV